MSIEEFGFKVVAEVLPRLLQNLGALRCTFYDLPVPAPIERRGENLEALAEVTALARERKRPNSSFIEALLDVAANKGRSAEVLDAASFHQPMTAALRRYDEEVADLSAERIEELNKGTDRSSILVVSSRVATHDGLMHLPMLDFKLRRSSENDMTAEYVCRHVGGGTVLSSGSSYHYYGNNLMHQQEFENWLLRCQLLNSYVDGRWITHQLIERQAALRVSHKGRSEPPTVVTWTS